MRFLWILTLALVAVTVPAGAQQKNKVVKPSREEKTAKSGPALKASTPRTSSSQQLQKLEQQTVKSAAGPKSSGRTHVASVKTQHERANAPIHFTSGTGAHGGSSGTANSSKSRVRTKGNRH
jgi:hypothetical protein